MRVAVVSESSTGGALCIRERTEAHLLTLGAAEWLDWKTNLTVSRNQASRWLCRGNLPVAVHIVDSGESLSRK